MPFKIIAKEDLAQDITKLILDAPQVARKAAAGQFVVVIPDETGERIPLTLADWDALSGTITLVFQQIGYTTRKLSAFKPGESLAHVLGPLGRSTETANIKSVYCIAGGVGMAEIYPVSRHFKESGARVIGIIGARTKDMLILEKQMQEVCAELFVTTDDGSCGRRGFVIDPLKELLKSVEMSTHTQYPDLIYAIGPVRMMKAVAQTTAPYNIKTTVSLNPIMVDATGMCGACRCTVNGKTVFGCVDGPDFDAQSVDFDELEKRLALFKEQEKNIV